MEAFRSFLFFVKVRVCSWEPGNKSGPRRSYRDGETSRYYDEQGVASEARERGEERGAKHEWKVVSYVGGRYVRGAKRRVKGSFLKRYRRYMLLSLRSSLPSLLIQSHLLESPVCRGS